MRSEPVFEAGDLVEIPGGIFAALVIEVKKIRVLGVEQSGFHCRLHPNPTVLGEWWGESQLRPLLRARDTA